MVVNMHFRMAELARDILDDFENAELHFQRMLEYNATNSSALDGLIELYENLEDWSKASEMYRQKAEVAGDVVSKIAVLRQRAQMLDASAKDVDAALRSLRGILELDGVDILTLQALADILEREERWEALIEILERREKCAEDDKDKIAIQYRIGGIWEQELQNHEQAITTYRNVLDEVPDHQLALKALERLFTSLDRPRDLIDVFEQMARESKDKEEQVRLLGKVASTWEERFDGYENAVEVNDRILELDPKNLDVIRVQEKLLRQIGDWHRLIDFLARDAEISHETLDVASAYLQIGQVHEKELADTNSAEEYFRKALDSEENFLPALSELGDLYEKSGNWFNALEQMSLAAELTDVPGEAVELYYRIGKINEEMLLDIDNAVKAFTEALDLDSKHVPSVRALKEIAFQNKEYDDYVNWFRQEIDATQVEAARTKLHTELGLFYQDHFMDLDESAQEFEKALALDYAHIQAAQPLAYICFRNEAWERAENLLDIIVDRIDADENAAELCRQHYRLGYVCEKLSKAQKALKNYQRAYDIDSTFLPAMEGLGAALNRSERWDDASKIYQAILMHHRDGLTDAEVVDYYQQLGLLSFQLGDVEKARKFLEKALNIDRAHRESLNLLAEIHESEHQFEEAYEVLLRLVPFEKGPKRVQLLIKIGRLSKGELDDPYRAIDAYEDANKQAPGNREVLDALLPLYRQTRQSSRAVEVIEEIVRIESDEQARVRLNQMLGEIYRDELNNPGRAVQFFNAALDLDLTFISAFESIEELLSRSKDWRGLEENYVAMIRRIPEQRGKIKLVLWKNLGNLYRFKLKDSKAAIQAFRVLNKAKPDDLETLEVLGELLNRNSSTRDEAIKYYQQLIPLDKKSRTDHLHTLLRLYLDRKKPDQAAMVTFALSFYKGLKPDEAKLHLHYKTQKPRKAKRAMTRELWSSHLLHPAAKGAVGDIAKLVFRVAADALTQSPKQLGLEKKREWTKLNFDAPVPDFFLSQLKYVREVLGIGDFDVFVRKSSPLPVQPLNVPSPALGVGQQNEVFREMQPIQLWFLAGQQVAFLQPSFFLSKVLGAQKMQACIEAAVSLFEPNYPVESDPQAIAAYQKLLRRYGGDLSSAMKQPLKKLRKEGQRISFQKFFEGLEHSANRAGFVLCGRLSIPGQLLKTERPGIVRMDYAKQMNDLLQYSVSEAHYKLREKLEMITTRS